MLDEGVMLEANGVRNTKREGKQSGVCKSVTNACGLVAVKLGKKCKNLEERLTDHLVP